MTDMATETTLDLKKTVNLPKTGFAQRLIWRRRTGTTEKWAAMVSIN